jgi:hypothetical protein
MVDLTKWVEIENFDLSPEEWVGKRIFHNDLTRKTTYLDPCLGALPLGWCWVGYDDEDEIKARQKLTDILTRDFDPRDLDRSDDFARLSKRDWLRSSSQRTCDDLLAIVRTVMSEMSTLLEDLEDINSTLSSNNPSRLNEANRKRERGLEAIASWHVILMNVFRELSSKAEESMNGPGLIERINRMQMRRAEYEQCIRDAAYNLRMWPKTTRAYTDLLRLERKRLAALTQHFA